MDDLPVITPGEIVLLDAPAQEATLMITARMALAGPLCVLDTGNRFDAYRTARLIRRQTPEVHAVLGRIQVARAFTCYQVVTLFEQLSRAAVPHVVLDLLATFYDESVSLNESYRLLNIVLSRLKALRQSVPVVISLYPPRRSERLLLVQAVTDLADHIFTWEVTQQATPVTLF